MEQAFADRYRAAPRAAPRRWPASSFAPSPTSLVNATARPLPEEGQDIHELAVDRIRRPLRRPHVRAQPGLHARSRSPRWRSASAPTPRSSPSSTACCSSRCPTAASADLVMVWSTNAVEHRDRDTVAPLDFLDFRKAGAFADMQATYSFLVGAALRTAAGTEQIARDRGDAGDVRDARPPAGARPHVHAPGSCRRRSSSATASGGRGSAAIRTSSARVLTIQDHPRTIVGVMPPDFVFPYKIDARPERLLRDRRTSKPGCRWSSSTATAGRPAWPR